MILIICWTVINGFVDLSLEELSPNTPVQAYLEGIKNAATRGAMLTQQLVAFARKKLFALENANLNMVLNQMAPMIRRLVGEHIAVDLLLTNDLPLVESRCRQYGTGFDESDCQCA